MLPECGELASFGELAVLRGLRQSCDMSRTFTLRALFVVVTILCVAAAIFAAFPGPAIFAALAAGYLVPAVVVIVAMSSFSSQRVLTGFVGFQCAFAGGAVGFLLFATDVVVSTQPIPFWRLYLMDWEIAACAAGGAFLACVLILQFFPRVTKVQG